MVCGDAVMCVLVVRGDGGSNGGVSVLCGAVGCVVTKNQIVIGTG